MCAADPLPRLCGVVLAGGASRRFRRDKATFVLDGETLVDRAVRQLREVGLEVLVADAGRGSTAAAPSIPDGRGEGPAAGILGAAVARPGTALVVLACDLPNVPAALLTYLAGFAGTSDLVLPRWQDGLEPLCALWGPAALVTLDCRVRAGHMSVQELTEERELRVQRLTGEELARFGRPREIFRNLNRQPASAATEA